MLGFALLLIAIAVIFTVATVEFIIPRVIVAVANVDSWWSPVRTLPPPGEMYILVRGDPDGPFDSVIESVLDYEYSAKTREFFGPVANKVEDKDYLYNIGVAWVGFWRYFLWREVRYDKWEMSDENGKPTGTFTLVPKARGIKSKPGSTPSIFFRYNMATKIEAAETIGNFPVDGIIVFTVQIKNPSKAFFLAGGWESQTVAAVQGTFREYVSSRNIETLREEVRGRTGSLVESIKETCRNPTGLTELYGIDIIDTRFVSFDITTGDPVVSEAIVAKEVAILQAEAAAERGKGERQERIERSIGIRAEVEAWGSNPTGGTVAMAEAIKEARPNVIGAGVIASVDSKRKED